MIHKDAKKLEKAGNEGKTAGRCVPPVAPPRKLQLLPTKANLPGPFSGFKMTITAVH